MKDNEKGQMLITGAAGFAGYHIAIEGVKAGFKVRASDVSGNYINPVFEALGIDFQSADLTAPKQANNVCKGIDIIINAGCIQDHMISNDALYSANVDCIANLCNSAVQSGVQHFIHISSVGVYGSCQAIEKPVQENDAKLTPPLSQFNISKWDGEKIIWELIQQNQLNATILRPAAIYGVRPDSRNMPGLRAPDINKVVVVGKGEEIVSFVHVEDLSKAALHAVECKEMIGEAYNIVDDTFEKGKEFFNRLSAEFKGRNRDLLYLPFPLLAGMIEMSTLNELSIERFWSNNKLKSTGFQFNCPTIEMGMEDTLHWYRREGNLEL